ncbi:MAG TPA: hypothetical protein VH115_00560, partial [Solirubrobacteraceae bacterium]|nr:hypothetical protein [Solirubrobacteraceae bacterium]
MLAALLAGSGANSALARWQRVSPAASTAQPYSVCPAARRGVRCELIQDPTGGSLRLGPLSAGAITTGPEQEVSPATHGHGVEGGYSPSDLQSAYRLPSSTSRVRQTVAVVDAYDDPKAEGDLGIYRSQYGLGECTAQNGCFQKVDQRGGTTLPAPNRNWARETSLDLDMVSAICPNCRILLVEADNAEAASLAAAENEAVALGATEISDSYEESESSEQSAAYEHPGVPIAAAGGDNSYGVVSPAASADVIAVGGTTLVPATGRR